MENNKKKSLKPVRGLPDPVSITPGTVNRIRAEAKKWRKEVQLKVKDVTVTPWDCPILLKIPKRRRKHLICA